MSVPVLGSHDAEPSPSGRCHLGGEQSPLALDFSGPTIASQKLHADTQSTFLLSFWFEFYK